MKVYITAALRCFKHPHLHLLLSFIKQLLARIYLSQHALWSVYDTAHFALPLLWNNACELVSGYGSWLFSTYNANLLLCFSFPAFFGFGSSTQFDQAQPTPEALTQGKIMIKVIHIL